MPFRLYPDRSAAVGDDADDKRVPLLSAGHLAGSGAPDDTAEALPVAPTAAAPTAPGLSVIIPLSGDFARPLPAADGSNHPIADLRKIGRIYTTNRDVYFAAILAPLYTAFQVVLMTGGLKWFTWLTPASVDEALDQPTLLPDLFENYWTLVSLGVLLIAVLALNGKYIRQGNAYTITVGKTLCGRTSQCCTNRLSPMDNQALRTYTAGALVALLFVALGTVGSAVALEMRDGEIEALLQNPMKLFHPSLWVGIMAGFEMNVVPLVKRWGARMAKEQHAHYTRTGQRDAGSIAHLQTNGFGKLLGLLFAVCAGNAYTMINLAVAMPFLNAGPDRWGFVLLGIYTLSTGSLVNTVLYYNTGAEKKGWSSFVPQTLRFSETDTCCKKMSKAVLFTGLSLVSLVGALPLAKSAFDSTMKVTGFLLYARITAGSTAAVRASLSVSCYTPEEQQLTDHGPAWNRCLQLAGLFSVMIIRSSDIGRPRGASVEMTDVVAAGNAPGTAEVDTTALTTKRCSPTCCVRIRR